MMDDLKMLIEAVAKLPQMAIWVVVMFWAYKVVVIGSLYGLIRFIALKAYDYFIQQKTMPPKIVEIRPMLDGLVITGELDPLISQIKRICGKGISINSNYVHSGSVDWLREAIDDRIAKDIEKAKRKAQHSSSTMYP